MNFIKNNRERHFLKRMHFMMGTFLSIEISHPDEGEAREAIGGAFKEINRLEGLLSRFKEESRVYKINNLAHLEPQAIDDELFSLIAQCLDFSRKSDGAFDITVAPLLELWAEAERNNSLPGKEKISPLLPSVGYQNILLEEKAKTIFFKKAGVKIDFGAVGKGYALDRVVAFLKARQIEKARINFGGHLYFLGQSKLDNEFVGIRNPMQPEEVITSIALNNESISTSAVYERNFTIQGRTYGHLINPVDGRPIDNGILSVSVVSGCAMHSDIFSTAIFVLGLEKGMRLAKDFNDSEAIIITDNYGKAKIYSCLRPEKETLYN